MEIQKLSQRPQAFSGINVHVAGSLKTISPNVHDSAQKVGKKLTKIGEGLSQNYYVKLTKNYEYEPVPNLNSRGGILSDTAYVAVPTNKIVAVVGEEPKNFWQRILQGLGFTKTSEVVAKTNSEEDIFDAATLALKEFAGHPQV